MTTSTKWRLNVSANNGFAGNLVVGDLELRTAVGVARPFVHNTFAATVVDAGAASLLGIASLSTICGHVTTFQQVNFPFTVYIGGVGYSKCFVSPYGYVYFDTAGATWGYEQQTSYTTLSGKDPAVPHIILAGADPSTFTPSIHALYAGAENSGATFRIRLEMNAVSDSTPADTIWEVTFDSAAPNTVSIGLGTSGIVGTPIAGIGDGLYKPYVATFSTVVNKQYNITTFATTADGTATASSNVAPGGGGVFTANQATDVDADTYWEASAATGWWQYEYASTQAIVEYVVQSPSIVWNDHTAQPKDWTLEYWDGAAWIVADTQANQTAWSFSEARTYTLPPPPSNDGDVTLLGPTEAGLLSVPDNTLVGIEITMEALTASGVITVNNSIGDITLQSVTVAAVGYPHQMLDGGDLAPIWIDLQGSLEGPLPLPVMTLAATGTAGTISIGVARLQRMTMGVGGSMEPAMPLQELSVAGEMIGGAVMDASISILSTSVGGACLAGGIGDGSLIMPMLHAEGGQEGDVSLPPFDATGTAIAGAVASGDLSMQRLAVVADGAIAYADGTADGQINLAEWSISAASDSSAVITGAVSFSAMSVNASAAAGGISNGTLTLPLMTINAAGFADEVGTASITLPLLSLDALMQSAMSAPVFTSVVLNTQTKAVSMYAGLAINSMANFGGVTLAATASGIVALIGDSDDGTPISAMVAGGVSDLNSEQYKRVLCAYVGYRADGDLEMTMITDQHHEFIYQLAPRQIDHAHASRVKFGRGVQGRYWQWKLANKLGADFALDAVTLDATPLSRRTA